MVEEETTVPLTGDGGVPTKGNTKKSNANPRRRRNRNRNNRGGNQKKSSEASATDDNDEERTQPNSNSRKSNKSRSPTRSNKDQSKSRSPIRRNHSGSASSYSPNHNRRRKKLPPPADITVIVNREDLWDSAAQFQPDEDSTMHQSLPDVMVAPFFFANDWDLVGTAESDKPTASKPDGLSVAVSRVPHHWKRYNLPAKLLDPSHCEVIEESTPNPYDPDIVHPKYWAQRRRLFSRFDMGCQLDPEGWYSVTPEIIADHVANRMADAAFANQRSDDLNGGIVIFDAFCGCGGNSIAFGKIPSNLVSKVVCCDTDRTKLLKAAHNASLYNIPRDKLVFVECNSTFILQHCYKDGNFVLDQPTSNPPPYLPPPIMPATAPGGYPIGGLDMLPRRIDVVFMDPPWGGVDYEVLGKNGYDLQKNMKIQIATANDHYHVDGDGADDFFDSFATGTSGSKKSNMSQKARKRNFNKKPEGDFMDGMELLRVAAKASGTRLVVYDLPRNTNKTSLGKCALAAGYRGNIKLEEHYLNGRLKTVTAYMGADYCELINSFHHHHHHHHSGTLHGGSTSNDE